MPQAAQTPSSRPRFKGVRYMRSNLFPFPLELTISIFLWIAVLVIVIASMEIPKPFIDRKAQIISYMLFYNLVIYSVGILCFALGFKFIRILILVFFILSLVNFHQAGLYNEIKLIEWLLFGMKAISVALLFHPNVTRWVKDAGNNT